MRRVLLVLGLLTACKGADPVASCEAYVAAELACATEALGAAPTDRGPGDLGSGHTCDGEYGELKGDAAEGAALLHDCYAAAMDTADCSSPEGYDEAVRELQACEGAPQG